MTYEIFANRGNRWQQLTRRSHHENISSCETLPSAATSPSEKMLNRCVEWRVGEMKTKTLLSRPGRRVRERGDWRIINYFYHRLFYYCHLPKTFDLIPIEKASESRERKHDSRHFKSFSNRICCFRTTAKVASFAFVEHPAS